MWLCLKTGYLEIPWFSNHFPIFSASKPVVLGGNHLQTTLTSRVHQEMAMSLDSSKKMPVKGLIHLAAVLDDATLPKLTRRRSTPLGG